MGRRPKLKEIVSKQRQFDVLASQGKTVAESVRSIGVTEVTYYRWRKEYGGLKLDQVKRRLQLFLPTSIPMIASSIDPLPFRQARDGSLSAAPKGGAGHP